MWVDVPQLWTSEPSRSRLLFRMRHRGGRAGARRNAKNGHRDLRGRHRLDGARRKAGSRVAAPSHGTIFRRDARRHRAPRRRLSGLPSVYITVKASVFQLAPAGASDQLADRRFELWKIVVNSSRHDCMGGVEVVVGETVTHLSDLRPWNLGLVTQ